MSLVSDVLLILRDKLSFVESLGITPFSVVVRRYTWSDGGGLGTRTQTDTTIKPNPEVKMGTDGSLTLSSVVPPTPGCGYTYGTLVPDDSDSGEYVYLVTGPNGTHEYCFGSIDTSDAFEWKLTLMPLSTGGPE